MRTLRVWALSVHRDGPACPAIRIPPQFVAGATTASVDGQEIGVTSSTLASSEAGVYEVVMDLPDDLEPGTHMLTIAVDGIESNEVEFLTE